MLAAHIIGTTNSPNAAFSQRDILEKPLREGIVYKCIFGIMDM